MKLDFNFTGKTLLKDWWKQVKTNFQTVQDDFNSEADARNKADTVLQNNINKHAAEKATDSKYSHVKLSDSVTSASGISGATAATPAAVKTAYDKAVDVQRNLDTEKSSRQNADNTLQQKINTEAINRQNADNNLQVRIDEISQSSGASALFGENTIQHTVQFVNPTTIPTLDWVNKACAEHGEGMKIDTAALSLETSFFIDGEQAAVTSVNDNIHAVEDSIYIIIKYNVKTGSVELYSSGNAVESAIDGDVWTFTPFHYYDIVIEWDDGTGHYWIDGYQTEHTTANEDENGSIYKVSANYERLRTLDNLNTENKGSFLDAINEVEKRTEQLLDCRRSATIVVGASDSKYHSDNIHSANYECTGTADQGQINSAIAALPSSGGKIVLLEGTYNISGSITVNKPNVTIEGMGNGTVLQTSLNISAINVSSSNCKLRNLSLTCTASDRCGNGIYVTGSYPIIENVRITHFEHNIYLAPGSDYAIVTKCHLSDGEGVCVRSKYSIISNNSIENHDWAGIYLYGPSYCNITGNILKDTGYGIFSQAAETQYNKISNNYILRGTGTSADYPSGKYTIYIVAGTYNYFSDNYIPGKNYVNNAGNTNTFTNNRYS